MRQTAPPDTRPAKFDSRARAASGEKITGTSQVAILREPSLATVRRAASTPTCSGSSSAPDEARRGPVGSVALLAAFVVGDRLHRQRRVRAAARAGEPGRGRERRRADAAPEDRALGVGDARVQLARRRFGLPRAPDRLGDVDAQHLLRPTGPGPAPRAPSPRAPASRPSDRARPAPPAPRSRARDASSRRARSPRCTSAPAR